MKYLTLFSGRNKKKKIFAKKARAAENFIQQAKI